MTSTTGDQMDDRTSTKHAVIEIPLRGLAAEGAEQAIHDALSRIPGVASIDVETAAFRARVSHDGRPGVREAIDAALHRLGMSRAHLGEERR